MTLTLLQTAQLLRPYGSQLPRTSRRTVTSLYAPRNEAEKNTHETYPLQPVAAVTALGTVGGLLDVLNAQVATRSLDAVRRTDQRACK